MTANRTDGPGVLDRDALDRLIDHLGADALQHLASLARAREHPRPAFIDPERAAAELVAMAEAGATPSLGWWRRNLIRGES